MPGAKSVLSDVAQTLRPPAGDRHGPLTPIMVALTCVTGVVDAASYLKLGHVFVANMTGNVVFLGFALAGSASASAKSSLIALASFLVGAFVGGWLGSRTAAHRGHLLRAGTILQVSLLCVAVVVAATGQVDDEAVPDSLLVAMALAMGVQNAIVGRLAVPELMTTVLTRTLSGIASESSLVGGPGSRLGRRATAVAAMLLGALAGGLLVLNSSVAAALGLATAIVFAAGLAIHLLSRTDAAWTRA